MQIDFQDVESKKEIKVDLCDKLGEGSNSFVFNVNVPNVKGEYVAKCSKTAGNYISFNLQRISCQKLYCFRKDGVLVPQILGYGTTEKAEDVLILEKFDNLYEIPFIINNGFYFGEIIIKKAAEALAKLHNLGISGYDVEFYWKADENKLVLLDVGPQFTFNTRTDVMLSEHLNIESNNPMGRWNIISQILPIDMAKKYYKHEEDYGITELCEYVCTDSMKKHIANVAKIHALALIARLSPGKQHYYLKLFVHEYKKYSNSLSLDAALYLSEFKKTIENKIRYAKACLYYSQVDTLCQESCSVELEAGEWK